METANFYMIETLEDEWEAVEQERFEITIEDLHSLLQLLNNVAFTPKEEYCYSEIMEFVSMEAVLRLSEDLEELLC